MTKGRPRQFKEDEALEIAMRLFWKRGYEGTSLTDLTRAMGISRPSLYSAFGDKRKLFVRTLDRYRGSLASYVNRALDRPTAREVFESLLRGVIDLVTDPQNPGGCLFVCVSVPPSEGSEAVSAELVRRRMLGEDEIRERFEHAVSEGDLPPDADPNVLAKLATTLMWGFAIQSTHGAERSTLLKTAELAAAAFPHPKAQKPLA